MISPSLHRFLVPNAPPLRRTERDIVPGTAVATRSAAVRQARPGLSSPTLVSSCDGAIERILLCFPASLAVRTEMEAGYRSVVAALRKGTQFVVAHNVSVGSLVAGWFHAAGHGPEAVSYVPIPDFVSLTDWAEDPYVVVADADDGAHYLMEPWEFGRGGDALVADYVEEYADLRATGSPLIFQGGNCLVGDDFWLLGTDYFADTVNLLGRDRPPVALPEGTGLTDSARELFRQYVDADRRLVLVGTRRAIPLEALHGSRAGDDFFLDLATDGAGTFQPILHIDMFVTLIGRDGSGAFQVLVGSPALADELLGISSPFALAEVYDAIAADFASMGFAVRRNPLVHHPTVTRAVEFSALLQQAEQPGSDEHLERAVRQLAEAGATDSSTIQVRSWHHITWNNCLVENSSSYGRHVYLPTYGHGDRAHLSVIDRHMTELWQELGFEVHLLADFNPFAERQGVVHCIKKYLSRSSAQAPK